MKVGQMTDFDFTYLSYGAGVQSTALLVCSALRLENVPRCDVAIFADTGDEPAWVYENLATLTHWARPHGIEIETVQCGAPRWRLGSGTPGREQTLRGDTGVHRGEGWARVDVATAMYP